MRGDLRDRWARCAHVAHGAHRCAGDELEHADDLRQLAGLIFEALGGSRTLLDQRGVLLRHLIELHDGGVDLRDAVALLGRCGGDLADDVGHTLHRADDLLHRLAGVADEPRTGFDPLDARADQALDLFGRFGRAAREVAHFAGDHRKAAALLSRTRGFDRSVQRKDVGLERDAVDDADDVGDLLRARVDLVHRRDDLRDDLATACGDFSCRRGELIRLACRVGGLLDGAGELLHRRCSLLQVARGLLGARAQVLVAGRDFAARVGDRVDRIAHAAKRLLELAAQRFDFADQVADLVALFAVEGLRQVAGRQRGDGPGELLQRSRAKQGVDRKGHRLQLQGDVGERAGNGDDGDDGGNGLALAVAGSEKVGNRGDVLALGQAHDAQQEAPAEDEQQDRAEIDGDEIVAGGRGLSDAAEERPRGTVDGERQRVDQRPAVARPGEASGAVGIPRQRKQDTDVSQRKPDDTPAFDHDARNPPPGAAVSRRGAARSVGRLLPDAGYTAGSRSACPTAGR